MKKKLLASILTACMLFTMLPTTALAAEPDMDSDVINVHASNAQDVLDGRYGDITGKTINFTEDITEVLDLARPTKYEGSRTVYECKNGNSHSGEAKTFTDATEFLAHFGEKEWHTTPNYYRTLEDVTFTADEGVTVAGFTFNAGHAYGECYDYVRDKAYTSGSAYYKYSSLENITFEGLTVTGHFDAKLYLEGCTVENITFDGCTFTGTTADSKNAAIKFLADNQYFTNITVRDCVISGYFQGIFISGVDSATIANNSISNTVHNAIALQSHANPAKGTIDVAENYIHDVSDRAIRLNAVSGGAVISVNNNIMVNCGDEGQLIKAGEVATGASIDLENNYWNDTDVSTAVSGLTAPSSVGITGGTFPIDVSDYCAAGYTYDKTTGGVVIDPESGVFTVVVDNVGYTDIQEAIIAAAPSGTVELLGDVTVDKWVMFTQSLTIGTDQLITLESIDGLTIDGNGHKLNINSIESAGNGGFLFYDATELNIQDLTINYANDVGGGICLSSGTISDVTINGGKGIFPGANGVTITGCTFNTTGDALYYEDARENIVITGNTFNVNPISNVVILRSNEQFTNNIVNSGRTVNIAKTSSATVAENNFNNVRFKVYNEATATISGNKINTLMFNDESKVNSTFVANELSDTAKSVLENAQVENTPYAAQIGDTSYYATLAAAIDAAEDGDTVTLLQNVTLDGTGKGNNEGLLTINKNITLNGNGKTLTADNITVTGGKGPSIVNVESPATDVTIKDLIVDGGNQAKHGLNIYKVDTVTLENVTVKNNRWYAVVNNSSDVTVNGLITSGNQWGVNVDSKDGNASLTVNDANISESSSIVLETSGSTSDAPTTEINGGSFQHIVAGESGDSANLTISGGKFATDAGPNGSVNVADHLAPGLAVDGNGNVYTPSTGGDSYEPSGDYIVSVDKTTGGKVTVNPGRADKGDTVTITVRPDKGYELDSLTVTAKNGDTVKLTEKSGNKFTFKMSDSKVTVEAIFVKENSEKPVVTLPFADVNKGDWFYDAVEYVYSNDLMNGTSATAFSPYLTTSRAMMLTMLARYDGVDTTTGSTWYEAGAVWAVAEGISDGTNLEADLTREQLVTMLWRYTGSPVVESDLSAYPDGASVSDWAVNAMIWATQTGVITGNGAGALAPQGTATRAEVATILARFCAMER